MSNDQGIGSVCNNRCDTAGGDTVPVCNSGNALGSGCGSVLGESTQAADSATGCASTGHSSGGDGGATTKIYNDEGIEIDPLTGEVRINALIASFGWTTFPRMDDPDIDEKIDKIQERMGDRLNAAATIRQKAERKARAKEQSAKTLEQFFGLLLAEHARLKRERERIKGKTVDYDYLSVSFTKTGGTSIYDRNALDLQLVTNPELAKKMGIEIKTVQTPVYKPEDIYKAINGGKVKASELRGLRTDEIDEYGKHSFRALEVR